MAEELSPSAAAEAAVFAPERGPRSTTPFVRDRLTWLLYVLFGFTGAIINGLGPSVDGLRVEAGLSHAEANLHSSLMAIGTLIAGLTGERVIRRLGMRRTLWVGTIGLNAGILVFVASRALPVTLAGALLAGIASAMLLILIPSLLSDRHGVNRSAAFSEINSIASGMGACAPLLIGASIAAGLSWRPGFAIAAVAMLPVLVFFSGSVEIPERVAGEAPLRGSLPRLFWAYWVGIILVVSIEFCMLFGTTSFLRDRFGLDGATAASSLTLFLIGMVAGRASAGRLVLHQTAERLLALGLVTAMAGFALFWLVPIAPIALIGALITGLGIAPLYPMTLGLAVGVAPHVASLATARCSMASGTAVLVAPLVLGIIADLAGLSVAYAIVPVVAALAAVTLFIARRASRAAIGSAAGG